MLENRIAMMGMYGGMWREYNPGCLATCIATHQEISKRINIPIDIYSIDNKNQYLPTTQIIDNIRLSFFKEENQRLFFKKLTKRYHNIIIGGDILWGGDDVVKDNPIFFLEFASQSHKNNFVFNCMHTFYTDKNIHKVGKKLRLAIEKASYTSVRTKAVQQRIQNNLQPQKPIYHVPDIALKLSIGQQQIPCIPMESVGVSVRDKLKEHLEPFIQTASPIMQLFIYPFSRQYSSLKTVDFFKEKYQLNCLKFYFSPMQTMALTAKFKCLITDTYHGITSAVIHRIPFISIDVEPEITSRKQQLLEDLGIPQIYNIRTTLGSAIETEKIIHLIKNPLIYNETKIKDVLQKIDTHFDDICKTIVYSHEIH